ncbi:uncharacterized protein LOC121874922 isoform X2 [Homarus americanus]|uniref:uncharacterized protein LOC121874922 isoform X2 n=1 Tax=Homarus americanus TaxID=6706 RepID=UPI001C48EB8E|nr:uncharacterized protein LOC121874922 isoform X2 [Homarus americanus]
MVGGIYEVVRLVGGLRGNHFTTATTSTTPRAITAALATSGGDIIIFNHREGESTTSRIPWTTEQNRKPVALAFSPTAEWLLVASEDGTLFVVPLGSRLDPGTSRDHRFKTDDVLVLPPNGSRARPTSLVWWQTLVGDASLAIIGTELGELSFIELSSGKEVGGTYITVPVKQLHLCRDNSLDTVYLLITGPEDRQWRLVLEQRSSQYLFPLEHITPEWPEDESPSGSLHRTGPPTRSRLLGLKQLSVEKLQMLKQRLAEAKTGSRRKPLTENKEGETAPTVAARPERLCKFIHDVLATPQYAKERYLLAGHCKPNSTLMVYSTDLEPTPLYVFKIIPDADKVVLQDEMIFLSDTESNRKITMVSTFFSSSSKIDGTIDSKINPVIQEIELPEEEEILCLYPSPPLVSSEVNSSPPCSGRSSVLGRIIRGEEDEEEDVELPTHTWPHGCLILTSKALYICQPRMSVESLFMNLVLRAGDIDSANKLGVIFSLDPKLFELAADVKLRSRNFSTAIALYKHSRCPHVKCSIKFAAQGLVTEFLTYMGTLTSGVSGPDLGAEERRNLANLAIMCHLHHLCLPGPHKPPSQQQALRNLLLFLRDNQYYDEILALTLAAGAWRWETLQYLAASRGLYLEKLQVLLSSRASPILDTLSVEQLCSSTNKDGVLPIAREREAGYLHCVSDPELRQVLLVRPSLARMHIALVLSLLATVEIPILRRLVDLYNPTQPAIRPFMQTTNGRKQAFPPLSSMVQNSCLLPCSNEELVSVEAFIEVFLAIIVQLNQRRGWKYNPDLLMYKMEVSKEQSVPVPIEKVRRQVLCCGYGHTAVVISGAVYTWGIPDYGVLGHGPRTTTNHKLFSGLTVYLPEDQESTINGTIPHVMGGSSPLAPLMNGKVTSSLVCDGSEPRLVSYFGQMRALCIAGGKNHMLAVTDNGVYGWGSNKYGQVGIGGTGRCPRPTLLASLEGKGIISVACGQFHSLAVSEDGKLYTWGWGVHGQLGNSNVEDCLTPTPVQRLARKHIVLADGGYAHSVAMSSDGNVYAWGCGTYGQIGNGGIVKVTRPERVPLPGPATHLASGYFQNIAVTKNHKVYMWGNNPACLRVQAQLQRRARTTQQAAEGMRKNNGGDRQTVETRNESADIGVEVEKEVEGSEEACVTLNEKKSDVNTNGANDNYSEPVNTVDGNEHLCDEVPISTTVDDSEDTITTLPEDDEDSDSTDGAKSFVISPEPSPEKLTENGEGKSDTSDDVPESKAMDCANSSSTNHSSNPHASCSKEDSSTSNNSKSEENSIPCGGSRKVSANTVPSCDPSDLGHLLPQEVEMPHGFGAVRAVACGSQHCILLTTHGALYAWGRNMSGQLGTGNRREVLSPTRILDEAYITDIACGADFTLALESQGQLWGWGSNYYSQLGKSNTTEEDKGQAGRVFMLRTTKRVLKVPHSVHSNCESPRVINGLPPHPSPPPHHYGMSTNSQERVCDSRFRRFAVSRWWLWCLACEPFRAAQRVIPRAHSISPSVHAQPLPPKGGAHWWLSQVRLDMMDVPVDEKGGARTDDVDDGLYGDCTLHAALTFLHSSYNIKNVTNMLQEAEAHQALATLYTLERQYSQAMHHHLCALLKQSGDLYKKDNGQKNEGDDSTKENQEEKNIKDENFSSQDKQQSLPSSPEKSCRLFTVTQRIRELLLLLHKIHSFIMKLVLSTMRYLVAEAVRIIDHYLKLQTEESQTGMRHVLQEGISLWLSHALPLAQLEDLLLTHLPRTVYPLALLLFGDGAPNDNEATEDPSNDPAMKVLSQLSTKFCLNLCTSVISHLQAGGAGGEYVDTLALISGVQPGTEPSQSNRTSAVFNEESSQLDVAVDALTKKASESINLTQDDITKLQKEESAQGKKTETRGSISIGSHKQKGGSKIPKEQEKDCVLFTCGHHFTKKDFKTRVLPQMETSVMTVPGLLGNTARVLLDQYHSDQPEMACPHCVLAHLTIKLTKHKQAK